MRYGTNLTLAFALMIGMMMPAVADDAADLYEDERASEAESLSVDSISDNQLEGFLEAASEIESIRAEYTEQVESEGASAQRSAQDEMVEAVESNGLEVDEYREIARLVADDEDLRMRLNGIAADSG
ncbi:MAG: DUF4168 domain-containing protein [Halofilum sp. (in: g-proteobacteria)]